MIERAVLMEGREPASIEERVQAQARCSTVERKLGEIEKGG